MKKCLALTLFASLIVLAGSNSDRLVAAASAPKAAFSLTPKSDGVVTTVLPNGAGVIQTLRGPAANAYMEGVYARIPRLGAAHEKAKRHLIGLGYKQTDHIFVARYLYNRPPPIVTSTVTAAFKLTPVQTFDTYGDESDITFTSYDDGDWSHWTGEFSGINHTQNAWADYSAENDDSDVSTIFSQVNWAYLEDDSNDSPPHYIRYDQSGASDAAKMLAVQNRYPDVWYGGARPKISLVKWRGNFRGYFGCSAEGCSAAAGASLFMGPAAPETFFGGCTTVLIGCGFGNLWDSWV